MNHVSLPEELNQPLPRQIKARKSFKGMLLSWPLILAGLLVFFIHPISNTVAQILVAIGGAFLVFIPIELVYSLKERKLVRYGFAAPVTILKTETVPGVRSGMPPNVIVTYKFTNQRGEIVQGTQKMPQWCWDNVIAPPAVLCDADSDFYPPIIPIINRPALR